MCRRRAGELDVGSVASCKSYIRLVVPICHPFQIPMAVAQRTGLVTRTCVRDVMSGGDRRIKRSCGAILVAIRSSRSPQRPDESDRTAARQRYCISLNGSSVCARRRHCSLHTIRSEDLWPARIALDDPHAARGKLDRGAANTRNVSSGRTDCD